jgi:tRNA modification GTPase
MPLVFAQRLLSIMNHTDDTIAAVSSPSHSSGTAGRTIIRISGDNAAAAIDDIFKPADLVNKPGITKGVITIADTIEVPVLVYWFLPPHSYTGQQFIEIHLYAAPPITERILEKIYCLARPAGPGEFTLRAYLNGKLGLAQAEAVAQIVSSSNNFQLSAAEKLLAGALGKNIEKIRNELIEIISLTEAGLDFSTEDIEFITKQQAEARICEVACHLTEILDSSIVYEEMIGCASVGLAGICNAGKSSLLNAMLAAIRSIVSDTVSTTRDVLTGILELANSRCVLFDCAGLAQNNPADILERLSFEASVEALAAAEMVIFCVDASKNDYTEDIAAAALLKRDRFILAAAKCDLLEADKLEQKAEELKLIFSVEPVLTSSVTGCGLAELKKIIENEIATSPAAAIEADDAIAINQRHRSRIEEAINNLNQAKEQIACDAEEIAAMFLRTANKELTMLETEDLDTDILERIFSRFCIGK